MKRNVNQPLTSTPQREAILAQARAEGRLIAEADCEHRVRRLADYGCAEICEACGKIFEANSK